MLLSSCASILNSSNQKVTIQKNEEDEILVAREVPSVVDGKYLLKRDGNAKQVTVKTEGYMDRNIVVGQYKRSPLYILSWVPFGALFLIPPLMDVSPKSYNYQKEINVKDIPLIPVVPPKEEKAKELQIRKVSVDLDGENMKYSFYGGYSNFLEDNVISQDMNKSNNSIKLENTTFSDVLNQQLKEKGYIDTNRRILKNSYLNNMLLNAEIIDLKISKVSSGGGQISFSFIFLNLSIKWELLDYYGESIYSHTTDTQSGHYDLSLPDVDGKSPNDLAIIEAVEAGFSEIINSEKVDSLMNDRSQIEKEAAVEEIQIKPSKEYVSNFNEAIESTVTIKMKDGFGSGFLISDDGYIITNYHVVSDTAKLKVELNDKTKKDIEIIRTSKLYDLALLKVDLTDKSDLKPFNLNKSKDFELATKVYAVGTPTAQDLSQSVTQGIISGIRSNSDTTTTKLIQTDASVNSGNSGGPLINKNGTVLGIVSSKVKGFSVEGVAFAIPAHNVYDRLNISLKEE